MTTRIAYFVFLRRSAKKHGGQVKRPREKVGQTNKMTRFLKTDEELHDTSVRVKKNFAV